MYKTDSVMAGNFLAVHAGAGKHSYRTENLCLRAVCSCDGDIVTALKILENDYRTNCGYGSNLTQNGNVECEAAFVSSQGPIFGAIGAVSRIQNPIEVAAMVAKEQLDRTENHFVLPSVLVSRGAERWAEQRGVHLCDPALLISKNSREQWKKAREIKCSLEIERMDTVGAVSYGDGSCCAACSSGGILLKAEGRLGHTTQIGGAIWADQRDSKNVAVALSGCGEYIAGTLLARNLAERLLTENSNDEFVIDKIKDTFKTSFLNSPYLENKNRQHILAGGLVLFVDKENRTAELVSFHNTAELTFAFGRNGKGKKYRSRSLSDDFVAHSFSLRDFISFVDLF